MCEAQGTREEQAVLFPRLSLESKEGGWDDTSLEAPQSATHKSQFKQLIP